MKELLFAPEVSAWSVETMIPHPLPGYPIGPVNSETGENYGTSEAHVERLGPGRFAVDIPAPEGTPIPLLAGWRQHDAGEDAERGRWVMMHQWDPESGQDIAMYCHLRGVGGDGIVGTVGQTGNATGPHLHYVLWRNGERVRPEDWVAFKEGQPVDRVAFEDGQPMDINAVRLHLDALWGIAGLLDAIKSPYAKEQRDRVVALKWELGLQ